MKNTTLFKYAFMLIAFAVFLTTEVFADETMFIIHPSSTQNQSQSISIPITLNNYQSNDIESIDLHIQYDPAVMTPTGISLSDTILENHNYLYEYNVSIPGIIYALFAASTEIHAGTGVLLKLDFIATGSYGESSNLTISTGLFNNVSVLKSDGLFTVAPNAAPIITGITAHTFDEDTATSLMISVNDIESNPCDLALTFNSSDETLIPNNAITYTCNSDDYYLSIVPLANQFGNVSIMITTTDTGNLSATRTLNLNVAAVNDAPSISFVSPTDNLTIDEDSTLPLTLTILDIDNDNLTLTASSTNTELVPVNNMTFSGTGSTRTMTISPATNKFGDTTITVSVSDGDLISTSTFDLTVSAVNDPPWVSEISDHSTIEDQIIESISLTVSDNEDAPCSMDVSITSSDTNLISNDNISFNCTDNTYSLSILPSADQNGVATITFTVIDTGALAASQSFDLMVSSANDAPVLANPISNRTAAEGSEFTYTIPSNTFLDVDSGDTLSYAARQSNGSALPGWLSFNPATRQFSGLPSNSDVGVITITVTATDGSAQSVTDSFILTVNNTNNAPVLDHPIVDQIILEDIAYSFTVPENTFRDDDPGDTLTYSANVDGSALPSWLSFNSSSRTFTGTPQNGNVGKMTITVIATDTLNMTAMDRFDLTVVNVNDAPEITLVNDQTIDEDTIAGPFSFEISDIDSNNLAVSARSSVKTLVRDSDITISGTSFSKNIVITPVTNANGETMITLSVTDGSLTTTTSFMLVVTPVNDIPVMSSISDSQSMDEGTSFSMTLTATDIEDDPLNVTAISADQNLISNNNIEIVNNGDMYNITITPNKYQAGNTNITLSVSDGTDITATVFTIIVNEVYYTIAGHVSNYNDISDSNLQNVTLTLSGSYSHTTTTDTNGNYTFSTVRPGDYLLTASKTDDIRLDIADAIKILNARARITRLNCLEKIAADVNNDGYNYAFDAAKITHYIAGYNNCLNDRCTFWQFITENIISCETWPLIEYESTRRYTDLTGDVFDQDFIGIGCGNVSQ